LNIRTGQITERTNSSWRPDEDWVNIGFKDHRYKPHGWDGEVYLCPLCGIYHAEYNSYGELTIRQRFIVKYGRVFGCKEAKKLMQIGSMLGGRKEHYEAVVKLRGIIDTWAPRLMQLEASQRRRVLRLLLKGREDDALAYIIARGLAKFWRIMGVIIKQFHRMRPEIEQILEAHRRVNTRDLQVYLERCVDKSFNALKPFSHEFRKVCDVREEYYRYELCVGTSINKRSWGRTRGREVSGDDLIKIVKNYGRAIQQHVRKPIREDFLRLVELTEKIKPYEQIRVERSLQKSDIRLNQRGSWVCRTRPNKFTYVYITHGGELKFEEHSFSKMWLTTDNPDRVRFNGKGEGEEEFTVYLLHIDELPVIEDILPDVIELYKEAEREVGKTRILNESIMAEMNKVAAPWLIARGLK